MKKQVLLIMFLLSAIVGTVKAAEVEISLQQVSASSEGKRNNQKGGIRHAPSVHPKLPTVILDGNSIQISTFVNGANLNLVLYDENDNIIYDMTTIATTSVWSTSLPNDIIDNTASLRLIVNDNIYIGKF